MNKVVLTGRITRDPEIRYTQTGIGTVSFSLAVDRQIKDASGNRQADFINCVAWRNQAEFISRYIKKGYMLCVEGRITTRSYQGQDNAMHYVTEVVVDQVENLTPRQNDMNGYVDNRQAGMQTNYQQPSYQQPSYQQPTYQQPTNQQSNYDNGPMSINNLSVDDDDLPF